MQFAVVVIVLMDIPAETVITLIGEEQFER